MGSGRNRPVMRNFGAEPAAGEAAAAMQKPMKLDAVWRGTMKGGVSKHRPRFIAQLNPDTVVEVNGDIAEFVFIRKKASPRGATVKGGVSKHRPRPIVQPNPDTMVKINGDTVEFFVTRKTASPREKVHTLSSVTSGRSEATCGITNNKPPETSHDIDALDVGNQLAVVDYVEEIYKFYRLSENSCRPHDYMGSQVEIDVEMRAGLADQLIEAHDKFKLMPETLYLTFYIIDRYLSLEMVSKRDLQLVGVTAMLMAYKYEELRAGKLPKCYKDIVSIPDRPPDVDDFIGVLELAYGREEIPEKEQQILDKLEWNLTIPTPYVFLVRFLKAAFSDKKMENMAFFLAELGLVHYSTITYLPSMIAASAVYVAQCTLGKAPLWSEMLKHHTGFSETQLRECAKCLVKFHLSAAESRLKVVYKKYSSPERCAVALHPPAIKLLEG